jgi:hypothetical protein
VGGGKPKQPTGPRNAKAKGKAPPRSPAPNPGKGKKVEKPKQPTGPRNANAKGKAPPRSPPPAPNPDKGNSKKVEKQKPPVKVAQPTKPRGPGFLSRVKKKAMDYAKEVSKDPKMRANMRAIVDAARNGASPGDNGESPPQTPPAPAPAPAPASLEQQTPPAPAPASQPPPPPPPPPRCQGVTECINDFAERNENEYPHILFPRKTSIKFIKQNNPPWEGLYKFEDSMFGSGHFLETKLGGKKTLNFEGEKVYSLGDEGNTIVMVWGRDAQYITINDDTPPTTNNQPVQPVVVKGQSESPPPVQPVVFKEPFKSQRQPVVPTQSDQQTATMVAKALWGALRIEGKGYSKL